jgi:hypothetical protein
MKYPVKAIWKNQDFDLEVMIVDVYGEHSGVVWYKSATGTGIPGHELEFQTFWNKLINIFK